MDAKDLLNYKNLSLLLAGNSSGVRKNKIPKKYKKDYDDLIFIIEFYLHTRKKKSNGEMMGKIKQ